MQSLKESLERYRQSPSDTLRNEIVTDCLDVVDHAFRLAFCRRVRLHPGIDPDDVKQAGCIALIGCVEKFDPSRGAGFRTFASKRVLGAMLDFVRSHDDVPRVSQQRYAAVSRAKELFSSRTGRPPSRQEIAAEMKLDPDSAEFLRAMAEESIDFKISGGVSLRANRNSLDQSLSRVVATAEELAYCDAPPPLRDWRPILKHLTAVEQKIVNLIYVDGLRMREVGDRLDLTESRISQIHAEAIRRLKSIASRSPIDASKLEEALL